MKTIISLAIGIFTILSCTHSKQSEIDKAFYLGWKHGLGGYLLSGEPTNDSTIIAYHTALVGKIDELPTHESLTAYLHGYKSAVKFIDSIEPYCEVDFDSAYTHYFTNFKNDKPARQ